VRNLNSQIPLKKSYKNLFIVLVLNIEIRDMIDFQVVVTSFGSITLRRIYVRKLWYIIFFHLQPCRCSRERNVWAWN